MDGFMRTREHILKKNMPFLSKMDQKWLRSIILSIWELARSKIEGKLTQFQNNGSQSILILFWWEFHYPTGNYLDFRKTMLEYTIVNHVTPYQPLFSSITSFQKQGLQFCSKTPFLEFKRMRYMPATQHVFFMVLASRSILCLETIPNQKAKWNHLWNEWSPNIYIRWQLVSVLNFGCKLTYPPGDKTLRSFLKRVVTEYIYWVTTRFNFKFCILSGYWPPPPPKYTTWIISKIGRFRHFLQKSTLIFAFAPPR